MQQLLNYQESQRHFSRVCSVMVSVRIRVRFSLSDREGIGLPGVE